MTSETVTHSVPEISQPEDASPLLLWESPCLWVMEFEDTASGVTNVMESDDGLLS